MNTRSHDVYKKRKCYGKINARQGTTEKKKSGGTTKAKITRAEDKVNVKQRRTESEKYVEIHKA